MDFEFSKELPMFYSFFTDIINVHINVLWYDRWKIEWNSTIFGISRKMDNLKRLSQISEIL